MPGKSVNKDDFRSIGGIRGEIRQKKKSPVLKFGASKWVKKR